jgi:nitric oxide-associated protein 1
MLRLRRVISLDIIRKYHQKPSIEHLIDKINDNNVSQKYAKALEKFEGKILFNSVLEVQNIRIRKYDELYARERRKKQRQYEHNVKTLPLILSQFCEETEKEEVKDEDEQNIEKSVQDLPYSRYLKVGKPTNETMKSEQERFPKDWLHDYELYDEAEDETESTYGTPDPRIPVSNVPCNGCGAHLHCKDSSIPGYVPSELFSGLSEDELKTVHCQRCHFLVNYNTAINVTVTAEDYINIISTIKDKHALAIVLIDLLDFPCSIFTGLKDILGPNRPIIIVGNKVDLIPKDHPNYLNHIKNCLEKEANKMGFQNIKNISLISAKTGYGVEELINKLHNIWEYKGDVYLIGCTNVGKSSLFNSLLRSDYCKVEAMDLIRRATACPWPGTTLRMLKFPILKPSDYRLYLRTQRLLKERNKKSVADQLRVDLAKSTNKIEHATLIGHIGLTFDHRYEKEEPATIGSQNHQHGFSGNILTLNEKSDKYAHSKWCFDTPGVIQKDQVGWLILHLKLF